MATEIRAHFPDIQFKKSTKLGSPSLPESSGIVFPNMGNPTTLDALGFTIHEIPPAWTPEQSITAFQVTMRSVENNLGIILPMQGRNIRFVPQQSLIPTTPVERARYLNKYGSDILDKLPRGRTIRKSDGTFDILIADLSKDGKTTLEAVLGTQAHEYGHTLGKEIEDPVLEEMKAEAFKLIFLKTYKKVDVHSLDLSNEKTDLHLTARSRLMQLVGEGMLEEAILAHLLGKNFGKFSPEDYKNTQLSRLSLHLRGNNPSQLI